MNDVLQQISNIGIIPVIAIEDAEQGGASGPGFGGRWSACRRGDLPHRGPVRKRSAGLPKRFRKCWWVPVRC